MSTQYFDSVIPVIAVKHLSGVLDWYTTLLGPAAEEPEEGIAEWNIAGDAWIQVCEDEDRAGTSSVILGVTDLVAQIELCIASGLNPGEIQDFGVIRLAELTDPEGNQINLVEEISEG